MSTGTEPAVELLVWEGCPSTDSARELLRREMREAGLDADAVRVRVLESDAEAERERFPGSPTIRVAGRDVVPPTEDEPLGLTCRLYRLQDGTPSPLPDPESLRRALREAAGGEG